MRGFSFCRSKTHKQKRFVKSYIRKKKPTCKHTQYRYRYMRTTIRWSIHQQRALNFPETRMIYASTSVNIIETVVFGHCIAIRWLTTCVFFFYKIRVGSKYSLHISIIYLLQVEKRYNNIIMYRNVYYVSFERTPAITMTSRHRLTIETFLWCFSIRKRLNYWDWTRI